MKNLPEKIYLQLNPNGEYPLDVYDDFNVLPGVLWSKERINETDVEYVLNTTHSNSGLFVELAKNNFSKSTNARIYMAVPRKYLRIIKRILLKERISHKPDYKGFYNYIKESGAPVGYEDLKRLAKKYNCPVPRVVDGRIVFDE